jgi:type I restriction enzyme S subunit
MKSDAASWPEVRLGDLVAIEHGYAFKGDHFVEAGPDDPIVVSIGNFKYTGGFRFATTAVKGYRGEYPERFRLAPGELLLVMTCQTPGGEILGIPGRIPDDGRTYLHNQRLGKARFLSETLDPAFAYWLFLSADFNRALYRTASGSKILHTAPSRIESYVFRLPPVERQRQIAALLDALDQKAALSEALSVRLDETVWTLFQRLFEASNDTVRIGDVARCLLGGTPARNRDEYWGGDVPWLASGAVNEFRVCEPTEYITEEGLAKSSAKMLPKGTTVLAITGATLGQYSRLEIEACANQSVIGILGNEALPDEFVYCAVRLMMPALLSRQTGGAQQHINKGDVENLRVPSPDATALSEYLGVARPCFELIGTLLLEARRLDRLKHTLLPGLVAGTVEISDDYQPPGLSGEDEISELADKEFVAV